MQFEIMFLSQLLNGGFAYLGVLLGRFIGSVLGAISSISASTVEAYLGSKYISRLFGRFAKLRIPVRNIAIACAVIPALASLFVNNALIALVLFSTAMLMATLMLSATYTYLGKSNSILVTRLGKSGIGLHLRPTSGLMSELPSLKLELLRLVIENNVDSITLDSPLLLRTAINKRVLEDLVHEFSIQEIIASITEDYVYEPNPLKSGLFAESIKTPAAKRNEPSTLVRSRKVVISLTSPNA